MANAGRRVASIAANIQGGILYFLLFVVLIIYHYSMTTALLLLSGVVGSAIGWSLGVFLSPFDPDQQKYFTPVVKSVTAFISGYFISYLNKFIDALFFQDHLLHPTRLIGAGIFITSLIATWIMVFIYRYIFDRPDEPGTTSMSGVTGSTAASLPEPTSDESSTATG